MQNPPESDEERLAVMRADACEELQFFSNKGKQKRERWVVRQFLRHSSLEFDESELISPEQSSKTDVQFREANFQVKEILNPGAKRSDEVKAIYRRVMAATKLDDVIGPPFLYDTPTPTSIYSLIVDEATRIGSISKYVAIKQELDLIFYVTRTHASPIHQKEICEEQLLQLGWRTISCFSEDRSVVLCAQNHAPAFLKNMVTRRAQ